MSVKVKEDRKAGGVSILLYYEHAGLTYAVAPTAVRDEPIPKDTSPEPTISLFRGEAWDLYEALRDYFWKEIVEKATDNVRLTVPQRSTEERELRAELAATERHLLDLQRLCGLAPLSKFKVTWNNEKSKKEARRVAAETMAESVEEASRKRMDEVLKGATSE